MAIFLMDSTPSLGQTKDWTIYSENYFMFKAVWHEGKPVLNELFQELKKYANVDALWHIVQIVFKMVIV